MAEWENGLFETDCNTCLGSWFCICCTFGRASDRLRNFPDDNAENISSCNTSCFSMCGASFAHLGWIPLLLKRGEVRQKFGIEGSGCTDCLVSYFCTCCAVSQMNREMKQRAELVKRQQPESGKYVPQQGMEYKGK